MLSVGIVMRTKNRAVLLKRALESVLNQTYPHWQLVVVNDGGETELVEKLLANYDSQWQGRMTVIHNSQSVGMEAASNLGLNQLDTDLAVIHDDDDSWSPDFLLRMTQVYVEQKQQFPNLGGVVCHVNHIIESVEGNIVHIEKSENFTQWVTTGLISLKSMLDFNQFPQISFLFELSTAKQLNQFDETLRVLGDWDFHLRFLLNKDIWLQGETLAFYHHRLNASGSLKSNKFHEDKQRAIFYTYLQNKWLRNDLNTGKFGMGAMMTLIAMQQK